MWKYMAQEQFQQVWEISDCGDLFYNFTNFPQYGGAIGLLARVEWQNNNHIF